MLNPIRIELPSVFEIGAVNTWLIREPEVVLIDCGEKTPQAWQALQDGLALYDINIQDVQKVLITHGHLDHIGLANKITQHSDAEIWMAEPIVPWALELKKSLDARTQALEVAIEELHLDGKKINFASSKFGYKRLSPYWDEIEENRIRTFAYGEWLQLGGLDWEVIHTPGHCINQTCLYQPETREFFSADMLLKMIPIPIIDVHIEAPFQRTKSLLMQVQSYQKLAQLDIGKAYPGHFEALENVEELIQNQLARIEAKKEQCYTLIRNGMDDFMAIWDSIYPKRKIPPTFLMVFGLIDILRDEDMISLDHKGKLTVKKQLN